MPFGESFSRLVLRGLATLAAVVALASCGGGTYQVSAFTPNRVLSWGWLPFLVPLFSKHWDFVYTLDWHTGFPYTAINANHEVVGSAGAHRFPEYVNFSPGLEWRFHFRRMYLGLRGVMENASDSGNPLVVNKNVDSPQFGMLSETFGRALTARIRLIQSK